MAKNEQAPAVAGNRRVILASGVVAVQAIAAIYFVVDGVEDFLLQLGSGPDLELLLEALVAFALLISVVLGARQLAQAVARAKQQEAALQVARGTMADLLRMRFEEWGLSRAEAEVATFALKGCTVGEIARMRNSAEGTVRSQLSQIYSKAGVTSQPMLVAQFIEELI